MIYLLFIIAVIGWTGLFYYRDKAKEFESLFELSKSYGNTMTALYPTDYPVPGTVIEPKLNKDGSIAKKRGRKARNENNS